MTTSGRDTGFVLRTWPLRESDLIVSVFAREEGKVRGVAGLRQFFGLTLSHRSRQGGFSRLSPPDRVSPPDRASLPGRGNADAPQWPGG